MRRRPTKVDWIGEPNAMALPITRPHVDLSRAFRLDTRDAVRRVAASTLSIRLGWGNLVRRHVALVELDLDDAQQVARLGSSRTTVASAACCDHPATPSHHQKYVSQPP
jgi:hypothetical protein